MGGCSHGGGGDGGGGDGGDDDNDDTVDRGTVTPLFRRKDRMR